jgi:hypothetical protein
MALLIMLNVPEGVQIKYYGINPLSFHLNYIYTDAIRSVHLAHSAWQRTFNLLYSTVLTATNGCMGNMNKCYFKLP